MRYRYLNQHQANVVHAWWRALQPEAMDRSPESKTDSGKLFWFDRGPRARLRRAASLAEVETENACFLLRDRLGELRSEWLDEHDSEWLPLVCGTVAAVGNDTGDERSLAQALGFASAVNDAPPMSELRFRRLMQPDDPESFFRQLRRALKLASGSVNTAQLADDLLGWCSELRVARRPVESMHFRWARDYYLTRKDRNAAQKNAAAPMTAGDAA